MRNITLKYSHFHLDNLQPWPILTEKKIYGISCINEFCTSLGFVSSLWEPGHNRDLY